MTDRTLPSLLRDRAQAEGNTLVYTFPDDRADEERNITMGELDAGARAFGARLLQYCAPGDSTLLTLPCGPGFILAFLGCLYAGVVAVPTPEPARSRERERWLSIIRIARPKCLVGSPALVRTAAALGFTLPAFSPEDVTPTEQSVWHRSADDPHALAFLQFTSGSTGDPKGVMVSHANITANEEMVRRAFGHDRSSTMVGWLPHFHDMGLIGNLLQPLYAGARAVLFSPLLFLRDPLGWLRLIAKYRAHTAGGPNFAYDLCVRHHARPRKAQLDIDLSSWKVAFVGAEPIRPSTMRAFADAFAIYGFDAGALFPCYGLAEATLFVTSADKGGGAHVREIASAADRPRQVVSCGRPAPGLDLRVVDPQTGEECPEGTEGEVFVAGPSIAAGYWERPIETAEVFQQPIAQGAAVYLRTGDLAIKSGDELFITGRRRDLIIVHGSKYYPQDIEAPAEAVSNGAMLGRAAAFAFEFQGGERVALVCEARMPTEAQAASGSPPAPRGRLPVDEIYATVRRAVAEAQDLNLDVVVLIRVRTLPMTTSGKVQRSAARQAFLAGTLEVVGASSLIVSDEPWSRALEPFRAQTDGNSWLRSRSVLAAP